MDTTANKQRIRFRNEALKIADFGYSLRDSLLETKGVIEVHINRRVGSVLVLFDKAKISTKKILTKISETLSIDFDKVLEGVKNLKKTLMSRKGRRYVKVGMFGAIATSLASLAFSSKWHAATGVAFAGTTALHLYQNKKTILK